MVRIAGVQFIGHADKAVNIEIAERMVRQAAARGARIACLPELFNTMYFCVETKPEYFDWAEPVPGPTTDRMGALARELGIVLIAPVFERLRPMLNPNPSFTMPRKLLFTRSGACTKNTQKYEKSGRHLAAPILQSLVEYQFGTAVFGFGG